MSEVVVVIICPQVRLAASVATRQFLLGLSEGDRFKFYNDLLPPLCLNRSVYTLHGTLSHLSTVRVVYRAGFSVLFIRGVWCGMVCVCIYIYIYIHTHTHTPMYVSLQLFV